jgi:hypothetical protein
MADSNPSRKVAVRHLSELVISQCHGERGIAGTSNDTELEKLKKRLQFAVNCIDCFVS